MSPSEAIFSPCSEPRLVRLALYAEPDDKRSSLQRRIAAQEYTDAFSERVTWGQTHLTAKRLGAVRLLFTS